MDTRFREENAFNLLVEISTSKLVFIDRKVNKAFRKTYKEILCKLSVNNYKYSDYDDNNLYEGEKVHIFGIDNLYIKVKLIDGICKILSMHKARYAL